jgi:hypothetical protein
MVFNTLAALMRAPIHAPSAIRPYVVVIIGVMLGSGFTPDFLNNLGGWAFSLVFVGAYLLIGGLIVVPYYRLVGKFDPVTAYFSGMPGGLNEMMIIGHDFGGDDRRIVLAHASRIVIVVMTLALWFRVISGLDLGDGISRGTALLDMPLSELAILAAGGVAGFILGRALHLPAPTLIGPMIVSAALYTSGLVASAPPVELVVAAQLMLGTMIGCRFIGDSPRDVARALVLGVGAAALLLAVTFGFALLLVDLLGRDMLAILLAFAPGGFTEMSLVALTLDIDVAYVASHHMMRIALVIIFAPLVFRLWQGWRRRK